MMCWSVCSPATSGPGRTVKLGYFGLYDYFTCGGFGDEHFDRDDVAHEAVGAATARERFVAARPCLGDRRHTAGRAVPRAVGARVAAVATGWHSSDELAAHSPDLL